MVENADQYCMCMHEAPGAPPDHRGEKAAVLRAAAWRRGERIPVAFLEGSAALQARVRDVAEEWTGPRMANLSFFWVEDPAATIRIAFQPGRGSWSYLGTVARRIPSPQPTINFGWLTEDTPEAELRRVVLHEFGHALGLIHEHQNPKGGVQWNEAAVMADLTGPPNNWDAARVRTNILHRYDPEAVEATETDRTSIMMYPIPAAWTDDGFSAGLNGALSRTDRELICRVYPW